MIPVDRKQLKIRKLQDRFFQFAGIFVLMFSLLVLLILIFDLAQTGAERLNWSFFTQFPSRRAENAGIFSAWVGSGFVMLTTAFIAIPLGVGAGVYLEVYAPRNWLTRIIELNITNLAAIPSIVYGLMALGIFVYKFQLGRSILTAGLTLALLVLPIVIVTTREALRSVHPMIKEAAFALGATKWQTVRDHLVPYSTGGILTGVIIALSRAIGETAPLLTVGALTYIAFLPKGILDSYTVLPIQMFNWLSRPQTEFHVNAAAAGTILLLMTLLLNGLAIWIRYRYRKRIRW